MDHIELLSESSIKIEEIKLEPVDSGNENIEEYSQSSIKVESELNTCDATFHWQGDSEEEEVKPPVALFLQPDEELEESAEEQQDPLAVSDNILNSGEVKVEKTEDRSSSPGCGDGSWKAVDHGNVQSQLEGNAPGNLTCTVSKQTESTLHNSPREVKSFQRAMCTKRYPQANTVASLTLLSEGQRFSPGMKNANIAIPILNSNPASTEHSRGKDIHVHAQGKQRVSSDCEMLKKQQILSKSKICNPFSQDMRFHPSDKLHACAKRLGTKQALVRHERIHTGKLCSTGAPAKPVGDDVTGLLSFLGSIIRSIESEESRLELMCSLLQLVISARIADLKEQRKE